MCVDSSPALLWQHFPVAYTEGSRSCFVHPVPMSKKQHPKDIEQLLTDQTAVILEAVDTRLATQDKRLDRRFATQNRRIYGVERKVDKVITQLDAVLKKSEDHREEDVSGAEQLRRHDDQLQDHAVRIKKLETIRNP